MGPIGLSEVEGSVDMSTIGFVFNTSQLDSIGLIWDLWMWNWSWISYRKNVYINIYFNLSSPYVRLCMCIGATRRVSHLALALVERCRSRMLDKSRVGTKDSKTMSTQIFNHSTWYIAYFHTHMTCDRFLSLHNHICVKLESTMRYSQGL